MQESVLVDPKKGQAVTMSVTIGPCTQCGTRSGDLTQVGAGKLTEWLCDWCVDERNEELEQQHEEGSGGE